MSNFQELMESLQASIREIMPREAAEAQKRHPETVILDVRELSEWNEAHIPEAVHLPRGFLEMKIERLIPNKSTPVICQCASGRRSLLAANTLQQLGYANVSSMAGGISGWREAALPIETIEAHGTGPAAVDVVLDKRGRTSCASPAPCASSTLSKEERTRYACHLAIPEVGEEGQLKLRRAKVLIVGAGGLGSPAAYYLTAAGVGTIGIVDFDRVDASNLQRQILHASDRIGQPKVESARKTLLALNPYINVETHPVALTRDNVEKLFTRYDIIIDGSDNFPTRYLVNDACVKLQKPNVHGSISRFEGQMSLYWPGKGPCYRCLYPEPPAPGSAPSCAEAGVLGVLPGIIGTLEALETIKVILEKGNLMLGRLLTYDALKGEFRELKVFKDPHCLCAQIIS